MLEPANKAPARGPAEGAEVIRILHLEDDRDDRELILLTLRRAGLSCELTAVEMREEFVAALVRGGLDLILSDWARPQFSGREALEIAKERAPAVPFIFLSGTMGEDTAVECVLAGATDYVLKSHLARLAPAVRRALDEAAERRQLRQVEEELYRERGFLKAVLESLESGVAACNEEGRLNYFNRAAREFERERVEPVPPERWPEHFGLYQADGRTLLQPQEVPLLRALQGEHVQNVEIVLHPTGSQPRTLLISGQPVIDEGGRKRGAVVSWSDITELKRLEERFRQTQKMEAVGQLAGGIAHDFNNLLSVIVGYSDLALHQLRREDPLHGRIEQIRIAAQRATSLTRQLLAFSRRQIVAPKVLNLNLVLSDISKMLTHLLGESVELFMLQKEGLGHIKMDTGQLEQVIMNLALNARDAMPRGGKITVQTSDAVLDEAYAQQHPGVRPGRYVLLALSDTGVGMSPEVKARIFEPFFTTKEVEKGTGLGLATTYGIIQAAGGQIEVESEPGRGSAFRIYLPQVDAPSETATAGGLETLVRGSEMILVVEDEVMVRRFVCESLRHCGYTVLEAADAFRAEEVCRSRGGRIQLLLTDVILPGVGGRELAQRLARRGIRPRVLYMSGYVDDAILREGVQEHGVDFLPKPFTPSALSQMVRQVLDAPPPAEQPTVVQAEDTALPVSKA